MNFFKDPKYSLIRVVIILVVIVGAVWFVASNMNQSNSNKGLVVNQVLTPASGFLSVGMTGDIIKSLQNNLIDQGYLAATNNTGYYDDSTKGAVQAFQKAHGLPQTGRINLAFDDSTFSSLADQRAYEKYARNEAVAYATKNNIDLNKYSILRESTQGKLIPSTGFTAIPNTDLTYGTPSSTKVAGSPVVVITSKSGLPGDEVDGIWFGSRIKIDVNGTWHHTGWFQGWTYTPNLD